MADSSDICPLPLSSALCPPTSDLDFRMPFSLRATARAPGSIGNLGPGLDILGCAVEGACDSVTAEFVDQPGIVVLDAGHPEVSTNPDEHASALAAPAAENVAHAMQDAYERIGLVCRARVCRPDRVGTRIDTFPRT